MSNYIYQQGGINFLTEGKRRILGDDMGLGKTRQALKAVENLGCQRVLIITLNNVKSQWVEEIQQWVSPQAGVQIVQGEDFSTRETQLKRGAQFTVINFELIGPRTQNLKNEEGDSIPVVKRRHLETISKTPWDAIIVDEAHRVAHRESKTFKAMQEINRKDLNRPLFLLTGTPIINTPEEIWTLLHLLYPKKYTSYWTWVTETCDTGPNPYSQWTPVVKGLKDPEKTKQDLSRVLLRREKKDVLELPPVTYVHRTLEMSSEQQSLYSSMKKNLFVEIQGRVTEAETALTKVIRLQQLAISPDLLGPTNLGLRGPKAAAVGEILEGAGNQRVIVYSCFSTVVYRLYRMYFDAFLCGYFAGDLSDSERERTLRHWHEGKFDVLFTTIKSGGVGLNLTEASIEIFVDYAWAPASNNQAVDRCVRIGQDKPVTVYSLTMRDSIEEHVLKVLGDKSAIFDQMIPVERVEKAVLQSLESIQFGGWRISTEGITIDMSGSNQDPISTSRGETLMTTATAEAPKETSTENTPSAPSAEPVQPTGLNWTKIDTLRQAARGKHHSYEIDGTTNDGYATVSIDGKTLENPNALVEDKIHRFRGIRKAKEHAEKHNELAVSGHGAK